MRTHRFVCAYLLALSLAVFAESTPLPPPAPSASTPLAVFRNIKAQPDAVAFSPDGTQLLSASGFELLLWDVPSATSLRRLVIPEMFRDFTACAFSPDGQMILAGSNDGKIAIWDAKTGTLEHQLHREDWMYDCDFTPDRKHVLAVYQSGRVVMLELPTGRVSWEQQSPGVELCTISADGKRALTATEFGMTLWETATGEILRKFNQGGSARPEWSASPE